jgi:iron complex transport system substrate-binding protein
VRAGADRDPYRLIDGRFANTALRLTGEIGGVPGRGEQLAAYAEATFADVDGVLARAPPEARPGLYLARGPEASKPDSDARSTRRSPSA